MHQLRRLLLQPSSPLRVLSAKKSLASLKRCSHFSSSSESQISNSHLIEHLEENPNEPATGTTISVDRSGLYNPTEHSHEQNSESELVKHLKGIIKVVELSTIHGPNHLVLSAKVKREFLSAVLETLKMEFSNPAERRSTTQLAMKLCQVWGNCF